MCLDMVYKRAICIFLFNVPIFFKKNQNTTNFGPSSALMKIVPNCK